MSQPLEKNARKQHALGGRRCNVPIVATKEKEYHKVRVQNLSKKRKLHATTVSLSVSVVASLENQSKKRRSKHHISLLDLIPLNYVSTILERPLFEGWATVVVSARGHVHVILRFMCALALAGRRMR